MIELTYPGLYEEADAASNRQQSFFLRVIRAEYVVLFIASVLTVEIITQSWYIITYGCALALAALFLGIRTVKKPEQSWYQARALAESVKTATWKFVMRSKPFDIGDEPQDRAAFRNFLKDLLQANRHIGTQFDGSKSGLEQVTPEMLAIRALPLDERLSLYLASRVDSQRRWYTIKAASNRRWAKISIAMLFATYGIAFLVLLVRVSQPSWAFSHPDPILILATALIGWMQIKKYNELSASYSLTAIEIGILRSRVPEIATNDQLSDFIDDAEEAFSREHTQWLARRSN